MEPGYLTRIFLPFWLMIQAASPPHGAEPGHTHLQKNSYSSWLQFLGLTRGFEAKPVCPAAHRCANCEVTLGRTHELVPSLGVQWLVW